jgi:hypothetical protein
MQAYHKSRYIFNTHGNVRRQFGEFQPKFSHTRCGNLGKVIDLHFFIYFWAILEKAYNSSGETDTLSEKATTKLINGTDFKCMY